MKAAIRVNSLTLGGSGPKTLEAMEKHGKRLDKSSQARRVSDTEALVYGSLDLKDAYKAHVDGVRMNKGLKRPVLHAIVQFPTELKVTEKNERAMLSHAVRFINQTHGGNAVFAARLDRDEEGRHTVDVFFAPKYTKVTKRRGEEVWISTTKHGKDLAKKHQDKIRARHPKAKGLLTGPRHVGIALQEELTEYLCEIGLKLEARTEKKNSRPDRVDPETFKARKEAEAAQRATERELKRIKALRAELDEKERSINAERAALEAEKIEVEKTRNHLRDLATKLKVAITKAVRFSRRPEATTLEQIEAARMKKDAVKDLKEAEKNLPPPEDPFEDSSPGF